MCLFYIISTCQRRDRTVIVRHGKPGRGNRIDPLCIRHHLCQRCITVHACHLMERKIDLVIFADTGIFRRSACMQFRIIHRIRKHFFFDIATVTICRGNLTPVVHLFLQIQRIIFFHFGDDRTLDAALLADLTVFLYGHQLQIIPFCADHHTRRILIDGVIHIRILLHKFQIQIEAVPDLF